MALGHLQRVLETRNQSAARSLAEGLAETLTLHRLGVFALLGLSLKTTNCLESINALVSGVRRWIGGPIRINASAGWVSRHGFGK